MGFALSDKHIGHVTLEKYHKISFVSIKIIKMSFVSVRFKISIIGIGHFLLTNENNFQIDGFN